MSRPGNRRTKLPPMMRCFLPVTEDITGLFSWLASLPDASFASRCAGGGNRHVDRPCLPHLSPLAIVVPSSRAVNLVLYCTYRSMVRASASRTPRKPVTSVAACPVRVVPLVAGSTCRADNATGHRRCSGAYVCTCAQAVMAPGELPPSQRGRRAAGHRKLAVTRHTCRRSSKLSAAKGTQI